MTNPYRYYAHSASGRGKEAWQRLTDHLTQVAELAALRGAKFGFAGAAARAGLLHDLGKFTPAFQRRLEGGPSVDHATAGAQEVMRLAQTPKDRIIAELIAYAIAGHHAGLADRDGGAGGLRERLKKTLEPLDPIWREMLPLHAAQLMPSFAWADTPQKLAFQLAFLGRMLFSCLVDADHRDTDAFYAGIEGRCVDRDWAPLAGMVERMRSAFDEHIRGKSTDGALNRLRSEVLAHARSRAAMPRGLFTLTVPTGGGKTLASLGFALDHAKHHGLDRIIYAIPFTSVIDQTVDVFERVLGGGVVLAHHAGLDEERFVERAGADKLRLATQDWAAPVIVTTNVQFFESLFANRPARCKKLHNLARSVIVLDEAQTIPLHVLRPCLAALDELARNYGCSIVLCTATQPAVIAPEFPDGLVIPPKRELAPDPLGLHQRLKRVTARHAGVMTDDDLVAALRTIRQGLVIVNTRAHALALYRAAEAAGLAGALHLTTRQYADHRRSLLRDVRERLENGRPCRLIATSLVEAGVDLDFPRVWRAEAGLDSIVQAAGRCNREGRRDPMESVITVFEAAAFKPSQEVRALTGDMTRALARYPDLISLEAIQAYFEEVYWRKGSGLDRDDILACFGVSGGETHFAYRTVAEKFRLIEEGMVPVIVARSPMAQAALRDLDVRAASPGAIARRLQPYLVQVPPRARAILLAAGNAAFRAAGIYGDQFCVLAKPSMYDPVCGLLWESADDISLESPII